MLSPSLLPARRTSQYNPDPHKLSSLASPASHKRLYWRRSHRHAHILLWLLRKPPCPGGPGSVPHSSPTRAANHRIGRSQNTHAPNSDETLENLDPIQCLSSIARSPDPTAVMSRTPPPDFAERFGSVDRARLPSLFPSACSDSRRSYLSGFRRVCALANWRGPLELLFQTPRRLHPTSRPRHNSPPVQHAPAQVSHRAPALFARWHSRALMFRLPESRHNQEQRSNIPPGLNEPAHNSDPLQSPARTAASIF